MDGDFANTEVYQLHIALREISPAIWRRVLVRSDCTILDLHYTIQLTMGWMDKHLNCFTIHGKDYGVSHIGGMSFVDDPRKVRLADFRFRPKERFLYEYDFGDEWEHDIRLERTLPFDPSRTYPVCIAGRRACPPEDCGGSWAFMAWEQAYDPHYVLLRLEEMADDGVDDIERYRFELDEGNTWLRKEQFDRREINRRLKQYALGDEDWQWALCD